MASLLRLVLGINSSKIYSKRNKKEEMNHAHRDGLLVS